MAILMSWGSYFDGFDSFLLNYLPMYNKFRAPSMIIVIPTFLFCMMAVITLQRIIEAEDRTALWDRYKKGLMLSGGALLAVLLVYFSADFTAESDKNLMNWANSLRFSTRHCNDWKIPSRLSNVLPPTLRTNSARR